MSTKSMAKPKKKHTFLYEMKKNRGLYLMALPGILGFLLINYIPMGGVIIAFQDYNPIAGLWGSEWNGLKNFEFFFASNTAWQVTRNTILYNLLFIVLGIGLGMVFAILISGLRAQRMAGFYKSVLFLPYLLSWVVASFLLFSFLSVDRGIVNQVLAVLGVDPIQWYSEPKYWTVIIPLAYLWKNVGYFSVIFYAGITGISPDYYEAAEIDGASRLQQTLRITIPSLMPIVITLVLLQTGKIFFAAFGDWGLFYNLPMQSGILYPTTNVIDTYVYNALRQMNDFGMSTAVGLYQSVVGCVLVLLSNWAVRRYDKEQAMF